MRLPLRGSLVTTPTCTFTMDVITIRPPSFSKAETPSEYTNPSVEWLSETWHVTHSTLPMWKSKRNVRIQYTPLDPSQASIDRANTDRVDDLVSYQGLNSDKLHTVRGIDKATSDTRGEWDWRGRGWLKIAGSHWEVLGWGTEKQTGNKWVVTMFAKTLFTPAGIDIYSKAKDGLLAETLEAIKSALSNVSDGDVKKLSGELFEIKIDDARED
jgi:hypothetical protein